MSGVVAHPSNPLNKAVELYKRLMVMADKRGFSQLESELLISLMMASAILHAKTPEDRLRIVHRLHTQAAEFIEIKLVVAPEKEESEPPSEGA